MESLEPWSSICESKLVGLMRPALPLLPFRWWSCRWFDGLSLMCFHPTQLWRRLNVWSTTGAREHRLARHCGSASAGAEKSWQIGVKKKQKTQHGNPIKVAQSLTSFLFPSYFFSIAAALIDHFVFWIEAPNPWMLSVYVQWKTITI